MIDFIYGKAGTGKTTLIYERALHDAAKEEKVILLVPEQQVLSCERELAELNGMGVPMNLEVLSFGRLANTVFRAEGGLRYDYLTRAQKTVLLWRSMLSVAPGLKKYGTLTLKDKGFLSRAVGCIEEFKAYRVTPAMLEEASDSLPEEQKDFKSKLSDLSLIYSAYNETLARGYNDPSDDLEILLGILECSDFLNDYKVYLDSFNGYTALELEIVRLIFQKAKHTTVSLCYDRTDGIAFSGIAKADLSLRKMADECGDVSETVLTTPYRFKNEELAYLSENLWDFAKEPYPNKCENVRVCVAHDIYAESEFIARDIHKRIRKGARYRDFAVIVRSTGAYDGILNVFLEKYGIPHFLSRRKDITAHPAIKCIISALSIGIGGWQTDDVFSYAKCGYASISPDECNILENYVNGWGITGKRWHDEYRWNMNPDGYTEELTAKGVQTLETVNELRERLCKPINVLLSAFQKDTTVLSATEAVWSFITDINLKDQLPPQDASVWNCLLGALDGLVHCAADVKVSPDVYRDLLLILLSESNVGRIPEGNDQVTIGDASLLRLHPVEHVYVAGLLEGDFPKSVSDDSLLSDSEKTALGLMGINLSSNIDLRNSDELFYLWRAFSSPRCDLTATYPCATITGDSLKPSIAVSRILKLFPDVTAENSDTTDPLELIEEYHSSFEYIYLFKDTPAGKALTNIYSKDEKYRDRLSSLERSIQNIDNSLSKENVEKIWEKDISLTQSRIDTFSGCAFSYYCQHVLKLQEELKPRFDAANIGEFVHMLLERFMSRICADGDMRTDVDQNETEQIVDELISDYITKIFKDKSAVSPRLVTLLNRLRRTALMLIENILDEFRNSDFRPAFFELNISSSGENSLDAYVITAPDGTTMRLYGKIDRLDTYKNGDDVYVRIVDYKTGSHELKLSDIKKNKNLQLLLYLFAVWKTKDTNFIKRIGAENGEIKPAAVEYFMAKAPNLKLYFAPDEKELSELYSQGIERNGIALDDESILSAADKSSDKRFSLGTLLPLEDFSEVLKTIEETVCDISYQMRSGEAKAEWKGDKSAPCKYCEMQPICRIRRKKWKK